MVCQACRQDAALEVNAVALRRRRRARTVNCAPAELSAVRRVLGRAAAPAVLQAQIERAAVDAVRWSEVAVAALRARPRTTRARALFANAFGVAPEFVPAWRPAAATWRDLGELIALRLARAARILDGGWIRYFCWGSVAHCPECSNPPARYFACSSYRGRYHVCLGEGFWRAVRAGDCATMASTLLHEALHIYFSRTVADAGRSGNANCYERFVVLLNRQRLHAATRAMCPPAAMPRPAGPARQPRQPLRPRSPAVSPRPASAPRTTRGATLPAGRRR
jgi:hypothetical protein